MRLMKTLAASALALGLAGAAQAQDPYKVGFIYVGPVGDLGYSYQHDLGRQAVQDHFGDAVVTSYIESVPEGADAERVITQMARSGVDMIFTTSFGFMDATLNVAEEFPDVRFEHATGYRRADNVSTYSARFYEGRHVIGLMAGRLTESNTIGYIASFPIPEVIRGINAAYLAARSVNPDVEFKVVWAYTWFDPGKEAEAANALIDQGADVILQHTDSAAPMSIAENLGIYAFGQASNMANFGPNSQVTSILDVWDAYYIARVQAGIDGTWESMDTWDGIGPGMVQFAPFNADLPADVIAEAQAAIDALAAGEIHPFTGPINRQDGTAWLADGEVATDEALLTMDFYVEGITSEMPQ